MGRLEEVKEERKKGETTGRKGRLKSVRCCHYNHSHISREGLHSVIISCYGNKIISILQVAEILSESIHCNQPLQFIQYSDIAIMSICHYLPLHVYTCVQTITMFASYNLVQI